MKNPVSWFDIYVSDMARAQKFYESVLATQLQAFGDPSDASILMKAFDSEMGAYGITGALVKMEGAPVGQNSTVVYFACDDCSVEASRVQAAGGQIAREKYSIGEFGFVALVIDTEGNMIGLHSRV